MNSIILALLLPILQNPKPEIYQEPDTTGLGMLFGIILLFLILAWLGIQKKR